MPSSAQEDTDKNKADPIHQVSVPVYDGLRGTKEEKQPMSTTPRLRPSRRQSAIPAVDPLEEDAVKVTRVQTNPTARNVEEYRAKSWKNLWGLNDVGSGLLENKGSVARDHMANERTFLSWMRTSLGLATAGVGVTQLFKVASEDDETSRFLLKMGKPIGATFISISIFCIITGMFRFFKTQELLQEQKYPAARLSVSSLVLFVFAVCVTTLVTVLCS